MNRSSCQQAPHLPRPSAALGLGVLVAGLLGGCASGPQATPPGSAAPPAYERDGPGANPPPDLLQVPDAEPRVETLRVGGPNKPYEVLGQGYTPITTDTKVVERGLASWYGRKFHGRPTSSGEPYDMYAMTAAHPRLPIPSYARVRNLANGREVVVRINDRGPFHAGRILDLSYTAALKLGLLRGVGMVEVERLTNDEIRLGSWRRDAAAPAIAALPAGRLAPAPAAAAGGAAAVPMPASLAVAADEGEVQPPAGAAPSAAEPSPGAAPGAQAAAAASPSNGFWVQLGAFRQREAALDLRQRAARELQSLSPLLTVFDAPGSPAHRVQAGPYASREEASQVARQLRALLRLAPLVVERR